MIVKNKCTFCGRVTLNDQRQDYCSKACESMHIMKTQKTLKSFMGCNK